MFQLEMHSHCAGVSVCASASPETVVARYRAAGYHGLVSTNHINDGTFSRMEALPWAGKVDHFMTGYEALKKAAKADMTILLGCEINLHGAGNDYLIYGVTREWLLALGDPRDLSLKALSERVRGDGLMLFHAHPFRYGATLMPERLLDGIEVYNAHGGHDSHNYLSALWAEKKGLRCISGSDFHDPDSHIGGGLQTDFPIRDNETLLKTLREESYRLIKG